MSSPNITQDTSQGYNAEGSRSAHDCSKLELRLNMEIAELSSTCDHLRQNSNELEKLVPRLSINIADQSTDMISKLRAIKVINVLLAKVWRRRCGEVAALDDLVRKYQIRTNSLRDDLFLRNRMICREQKRADRLDVELRKVKQEMVGTSHNCATINNALSEALANEKELQEELSRKLLECSDLTKMLTESKQELQRSLKKYRKCAEELAEQQQQNRLLLTQNVEQEDEFRTLKDRFQTQHDNMVFAVHLKQESLNEAYELLKGYEQELAEFELKYNDLLKENRSMEALLQICEERRGYGLLHTLISMLTGSHWQLECASWANIKLIADNMVRSLNYLHRTPLAAPSLPISSMSLCLAITLIIGALC